ncbi:MAG: hypothetical protein C0600_01350 [Ignavibacteria bacterium]|nr:MAG: hypothetical protein C0600_01350 [Ignavibacteria bacterium]
MTVAISRVIFFCFFQKILSTWPLRTVYTYMKLNQIHGVRIMIASLRAAPHAICRMPYAICNEPYAVWAHASNAITYREDSA